jgi:uncharacterized protein YoxC|tara:strand:+ start:3677 stop:3997 length:321 start_codon:yes stop_codon:yes gene_type:complete
LTTLAIFFILRQDNVKVDVDAYEAQIRALEQKVDSLHAQNDSLVKEADSLEIKIDEYDIKIKNLNYSINVIKKETKQKLEAVDNLDDDELERFFTNRYRQYKDSIN